MRTWIRSLCGPWWEFLFFCEKILQSWVVLRNPLRDFVAHVGFANPACCMQQLVEVSACLVLRDWKLTRMNDSSGNTLVLQNNGPFANQPISLSAFSLSTDNKRAKNLHVQRSSGHRVRIHKIRQIRRKLNGAKNRSDKQRLLRLTLAHKRKEFAQQIEWRSNGEDDFRRELFNITRRGHNLLAKNPTDFTLGVKEHTSPQKSSYYYNSHPHY